MKFAGTDIADVYQAPSNDEWLIVGNGGDDVMRGGDGNDFILGNQGNDTLRGGGGTDIVKGGQGNDILYGGFGDDFLYGDKGNDITNSFQGNDVIFFKISGDAANDKFTDGADRLDGFTAGGDYIDLFGANADYSVVSFAQVGADTQVFYKSDLMATITNHTYTGFAQDYFEAPLPL